MGSKINLITKIKTNSSEILVTVRKDVINISATDHGHIKKN